MTDRLLILLVAGLWTVSPASAQPGPPVETFDLVLVGDHLRAETHRVALKANPTAGAAWTPLDDAACTDTDPLMVLPGLSVARYLGQDTRENHLTLRIKTQSSPKADRGALRAVYAVPSTPSSDSAACPQLARLARTAPATIRRHSLAAYERPRPAPLRTERPFLDHVEAPIRHRKPGVMEVEWLNILIGGDE